VIAACTAILQAHRDTRRRLEAEKALQDKAAALEESEARFRSLSEAVPVLLWTMRADGTLEYINRYWSEYAGHPDKAIDPERWRETLHPSEWDGFMSAWSEAVAAGMPFSREFRMRRASDGAYRWHLARAIPVKDASGALLKWLGTSVDIHDQKEFAELVRIKEQLDRQTRLLESVVGTMGDGLIVSDGAGKYLVFNEEAKKILGFSPETIMARREELAAQIKVFGPDGKTPLAPEQAPMQRALRGQEVRDEAFLMTGPMYPGGLWINVSSRSLALPEGRAAMAVFQDITLRKRAELALARQARGAALRAEIQALLNEEAPLDELFARATRKVAETLDVGLSLVFRLTEDGEALELIGSGGSLPTYPGRYRLPLGQGKIGLVASNRRPHLTNDLPNDPQARHLDWIREHGVTAFAGFPLLSGDLRLGATAIYSRQALEPEDLETLGSLAYIFAEGMRRRQAQQALRESEERFRTLVEGVQDYAIFLLDTGGRVVSWNSGAERITGHSKEEIAGQSYGFLYPEVERERGLPAQDLAVARDCGRFETEDIRVGKGGRVFWATVHIVAIRNAEGGHTGYAHVIRDITETRALYQALEDRTRRLEGLNKELEAFSYSVSHDLRAPLRSLDGFSRALEEQLGSSLDDASRAYLGRIRRASERMGVLIDALLDLSRLNRAELVSEELDFTALARQSVRDLVESQPERRVDVRVEEGMRAFGDRRQLERLLANLLGNAWKFTGPVAEPAIEVGADLGKARPVYYVRDNGVGFDMAFADKLFGAFQRLHGQNEFPGTGIGLALAQRIVLRHGGEIWAESAPGRGATFFFTLAAKGGTP